MTLTTTATTITATGPALELKNRASASIGYYGAKRNDHMACVRVTRLD
jgi:hypothetical protein